MAKTVTEGTVSVTLTVPVNGVGDHMVSAVEQGYEWFVWQNVVYGVDGGVTQASLLYPKDGDEDDIVEVIFTGLDFVRGLQLFLLAYPQGTSTVQYLGNGEWDIDANGADGIVQFAVYGELMFS